MDLDPAVIFRAPHMKEITSNLTVREPSVAAADYDSPSDGTSSETQTRTPTQTRMAIEEPCFLDAEPRPCTPLAESSICRAESTPLREEPLSSTSSQSSTPRPRVKRSRKMLDESAGLSNIIGIIVFISSNAGDPSDKKDEERKSHYSYGWSFYSGALSFIAAELLGVLAVHIYIEKNKDSRFRSSSSSSSSPYARIPSYRYRRRRSRSGSGDPSREPSPAGGGAKAAAGGGGGGGGGMGLGLGMGMGLPMGDISMYTLSSRDSTVKGPAGTMGPYSPERDRRGFLQVHNCFQKDEAAGNNRRTTPV